ELDEYQADAVPRHGMLRRRAQHLSISLERQLRVLPPEQPESEVKPSLDRRGVRLQRAAERIDRSLGVILVPEQDTEIVLRERVARIDLQRVHVTPLRLGVP